MRRIGKRTNSAIFLLLMGFSISAIAEPKMLVCEYRNVEAEEKMYRKWAEERRSEEYRAYADACKNSKYTSQYNFTFDTKGLSSTDFSNVEVQVNQACGAVVNDVIKGTMEATPSIISFNWETGISMSPTRTFNVDRKNLTAGHDAQRNSTCVLSDIDTSENLL